MNANRLKKKKKKGPSQFSRPLLPPWEDRTKSRWSASWKRVLTRTEPGCTLISDLQPSKWEKSISAVYKVPGLKDAVLVAPAAKDHS